jgi:hypothetical protein
MELFPIQACGTVGASASAQCRRGGSKMPVGRGQAAISSGLHFCKILTNSHLGRSGRYAVAACLLWGGFWRRHKDAG